MQLIDFVCFSYLCDKCDDERCSEAATDWQWAVKYFDSTDFNFNFNFSFSFIFMCRTLTSVSASFSYSSFWRKVLQRATLDTRTQLNTGSTCYNNNNNKEGLKQQQQLQWGAQTNCKYLQTAGKQICVLRALPFFFVSTVASFSVFSVFSLCLFTSPRDMFVGDMFVCVCAGRRLLVIPEHYAY